LTLRGRAWFPAGGGIPSAATETIRVRAIAIVVLLLLAPAAGAEGWAMRPGDVTLSAADLAALMAGAPVRFFDGGRSEYGADGTYAYVYANEDRAEGRYRVEADGSVCVDFVNGFARCDLYVRNGARVILIDRKGDRYPLRP
jgi:hypothetical protein